MDDDKQNEVDTSRAAGEPLKNKRTLELCFVSFIAVIVLSAFVAALTYDFVSARAPLSIMVPLLLLTGIQLKRSLAANRPEAVRSDLLQAFRGENRNFNTVVAFIGCMALLLTLIFVVGHYIGIAVFMFFLLRTISGESVRLSAILTAGVTTIIYILFEHGFNIELYRGLLFRLWSGYG